MQKFHSTEENSGAVNSSEENQIQKDTEEATEVNALDNYADTNNEIVVENVETAVATNDGSKKNKMQYAAFYAEEAEVEKDDAAKMKEFVKPYR